jgi:hypothetical protein
MLPRSWHDAYLKEALKQGWRYVESWLWMRVCLLNISRYIFIVWRLSILFKLDSNNPYYIWAELYFPNLNYLIILNTWPIWPSWRPRRSRFTSWSYLSFSTILFTAHFLVWPSYGDNKRLNSWSQTRLHCISCWKISSVRIYFFNWRKIMDLSGQKNILTNYLYNLNSVQFQLEIS